MRKHRWTLAIAGMFLLLAILVLRPVPIPDERDCLTLKARVANIYLSGSKDVIFQLYHQDRTFYINRGLEAGLDLKQLRSELINQEVTIKYPRYWTPLDPGNSIRHISKVEYEGRTIFTELR